MIASWNTTNRCNLYCEHCYRSAGTELEHELTTEEGFRLLDQLAESGFRLMVFSGGEPFMRDDILDLTRHAVSVGLRPVYGSNGTLLTLDMARKYYGDQLKSKLERINLAVDDIYTLLTEYKKKRNNK